MKFFKLTVVMSLALFISNNLKAQTSKTGNWCGSDQYMQQKYNQNPALLQQNALIDQYIIDHNEEIKASANNKQTINFIIPVVFHVITYNGAGNLSKANIDDQMLTINEDYQRLNADASNTRAQFLPYAADIQVEFRLAHLDPNGNCTEGITRDESPLSVEAGDAVKSVNYWNSKKYLNIWTVVNIAGGGPGIILGYAQFPATGINSTFGVVVNSSYVSRTDRTLTHEIGHCMGLYHTFQGGCSGNCSSSGDNCCDTPPVAADTYGCSSVQNTCNTDYQGPNPWGGVDMEDQIENYMSYDACQNMFSLDQKTRMNFYLNSTNTSTGLNQLTTASNLSATGTSTPYNPANCAPIADFSYDKEFICEGSSVTFTDDSYNALPTAWNWTFSGGSPNSSSSSNPTITYNTAGVYSATHQPSNAVGSDNITKSNIITVSSLTADYVGPILDGFENSTQFTNDWIVANGQDSYNWEHATTAAATGSSSIRVQNYNASSSGADIDYVVSPSYDLSTAINKTVKFKVAFAKRDAANTDRLMVYYSLNCGESWLLKLPVVTATLTTAPDQTTPFVPNASQWSEKTMDFTAQGSATNIRFKFQYESHGGNNIYLDDINIGDYVAGIDNFTNIGSFNVYPNPANAGAQISFYLAKRVDNLSIIVRNSVGQVVTNVINNQSFETGKYTLQVDKNRQLASGVYFIEFNADENVKVEKLIIQ